MCINRRQSTSFSPTTFWHEQSDDVNTEAADLMSDLQSAYCANHSTETALLKVMADILQVVDSGDLAVLALLDLFGTKHCCIVARNRIVLAAVCTGGLVLPCARLQSYGTYDALVSLFVCCLTAH